MGSRPHIFLSFNSRDRMWLDQLRDGLIARGLNVWAYPHDNDNLEGWEPQLDAAIERETSGCAVPPAAAIGLFSAFAQVLRRAQQTLRAGRPMGPREAVGQGREPGEEVDRALEDGHALASKSVATFH